MDDMFTFGRFLKDASHAKKYGIKRWHLQTLLLASGEMVALCHVQNALLLLHFTNETRWFTGPEWSRICQEFEFFRTKKTSSSNKQKQSDFNWINVNSYSTSPLERMGYLAAHSDDGGSESGNSDEFEGDDFALNDSIKIDGSNTDLNFSRIFALVSLKSYFFITEMSWKLLVHACNHPINVQGTNTHVAFFHRLEWRS